MLSIATTAGSVGGRVDVARGVALPHPDQDDNACRGGGRSAAKAVSASGAGPDADTCSRQSEAVSAARPKWRAKNRAELSRSYSGTG
jgi:hypothetical protein